MLVIRVYGIPEDFNKAKEKNSLFDHLLGTAESAVKELDIHLKDIRIFFPSDRLNFGLGEEIIIFVDRFFRYQRMSRQIGMNLAENLGIVAKNYFPNSVIKCEIKPCNPDLGFWSS